MQLHIAKFLNKRRFLGGWVWGGVGGVVLLVLGGWWCLGFFFFRGVCLGVFFGVLGFVFYFTVLAKQFNVGKHLSNIHTKYLKKKEIFLHYIFRGISEFYVQQAITLFLKGYLENS